MSKSEAPEVGWREPAAADIARALGRPESWVSKILLARKNASLRSPHSSDWWCSPKVIADALWEFFRGPVDVDPCSNPRSIIRSVRAYTRGGLVLPWRLPSKSAKRTCYENPPYSQLPAWTHKMLQEIAHGRVREHIRLTMFVPSSHWWVDMCSKARINPRILALKRLSFIDPDSKDPDQPIRYPCRFDPALVYFGPSPERFSRTFAHLTRWATWGRT